MPEATQLVSDRTEAWPKSVLGSAACPALRHGGRLPCHMVATAPVWLPSCGMAAGPEAVSVGATASQGDARQQHWHSGLQCHWRRQDHQGPSVASTRPRASQGCMCVRVSRCPYCVNRLVQGPSHEGNRTQKVDEGRERFTRKEGRRAIKASR